jgi:hypothetical protein
MAFRFPDSDDASTQEAQIIAPHSPPARAVEGLGGSFGRAGSRGRGSFKRGGSVPSAAAEESTTRERGENLQGESEQPVEITGALMSGKVSKLNKKTKVAPSPSPSP